MAQVPNELWTTHPNEVGRIKNAEPVHIMVVKTKPLPSVKHYPLREEARRGIAPVIAALLEQEVIREAVSECNTPILLVQKPGKQTWRFVQDLRAINKHTVSIHPVVPNPVTILSSIPSNTVCYTTIDLSSAYFSIPIHEDSQNLFAFNDEGVQCTWIVLPQGFADSLTLFSRALHKDLNNIVLTEGSTLVQYVDDLLIFDIRG